ncbi:MAG: SDR family oxidoreductase [Candidatus Nitrosopumilus sp. bin_7KS]
MNTITITGSQGLIGSELCKFLKKNNKIIEVDLQLGHDLTDELFVKNWFKKNKSNYLVNCFALNDHVDNERKKNTLFNSTLESFSQYMDVNLTSLFSVCREFARNNKNGGIVNFSGVYGTLSPRPDLYDGSHKDVGYCVSKAGVASLTQYLAIHLAPNIRANYIIPGGVLFNQKKKFVSALSKHIPMKRMMKKTELNGLIEYLCSEKSSYVTGSGFTIDGGYSFW